jgi:hypothetical protein
MMIAGNEGILRHLSLSTAYGYNSGQQVGNDAKTISGATGKSRN